MDAYTIAKPRGARSPFWLGLILVAAFSLLRAGVGFLSRQLFGGLTFEPTVPFLLFSLAVFAVMSVGLVGGWLFGLAGVSWDRLGWRRKGLAGAAGRGLLGFLLIYLFAFAWGMFTVQFLLPSLPAGMEVPAYRFTWGKLLVTAAWGFLITAWQEENLFRGYLQPLLVSRLGLWGGIFAQAALFTAAHLGFYSLWWQFVSAFAVGLILGWLRGRDRSLVSPYLAHALSLPLIG